MNASQTLAVLSRKADVGRVQVGHARVHPVNFTQALHRVIELAAFPEKPSYVVTPNAQHVVLLEGDPVLRNIYAEAALVIPDGASILLAARLLGNPLPERVAGVDLFQSVCERAVGFNLRIFLLGGRPGCAITAARKLQAANPGLQIAGTFCPGFGFEKDQRQLQELAWAIRQSRPHIVFVGLGAPKQEYWIYNHGRKLGVPVCVGVGGAFEVLSGVSPRAPKWMQRAGLEWLFRLALEPRRLWRRYLVGNAQFLAIVFRQMLRGRQSAKAKLVGYEARR